MKKRKSNFRNQTVSDAKRQKVASYGYLNLPEGVKALILKEKTREILLDIIPYVVTDSNHPDRDIDTECAVVDSHWYKRPFKVHRNIGVNNDTFVCPTSIGKKCPICAWVAEQKRKGTDWDDFKDTIAKDRDLYAVIPYSSKDHDEVIYVWDMSWFLFQNELNDQLEEDPDNGIFPDLEEGLTLKVKFRWEKFGKNLFPKTRDIEFLDRKEKYTEDILDEVPNLDELLNVLSYKELEAKFLEMEDSEDDESNDKVVEIEKEEKPKALLYRKPKTNLHKEKEKDSSESPKLTRQKREGKTEPHNENECPHGHVFGKDCGDHPDDCDECDKWDDCLEAQE